jgi:uncharacterized protein YeeX (DUF496 family)
VLVKDDKINQQTKTANKSCQDVLSIVLIFLKKKLQRTLHARNKSLNQNEIVHP